ncbi:MAG: hypothetical protein IPL01_22905 [Acidobacteria bacterium]|nr:hypothetical protein [Acidobacteriota bacterium]
MRSLLRTGFTLAISINMVIPPTTLISLRMAFDLIGFNTRTMSRTVKVAMQSGAPNLDTMRGSAPQAPPAYQMTGSLPPAGYDDPRPTTTGSFDAYLTDLTAGGNATGIAGTKPMQSADPTAGSAGVGGWSFNLDSQNYNFTAPVLSLPGRAGMGLSLALSYNSRVWTKSGDTMVFNADRGFPAPGWRLGFGEILVRSQANPAYNNGVTGRPSVIFIGPDGTRRDLALNGEGTAYQSYDSSYLKFDLTTRMLRFPDGTQMSFNAESMSNGDGRYLPTSIRDRNGNRIDISYATLSNGIVAPSYAIDTAGRRIDFNYQSNRLTSITQNRGGSVYSFAYIDYQAVTIQTNFAGLSLDPAGINGTTVYLPARITYPTGINYRFGYTDYGQIHTIQKWVPGIAGQGGERMAASTSFNLPWSSPAYPGQSNCPIFDHRTEWAENWQGGTPVIYQYYYWTEYGHKVYDPLYNLYRVFHNGMTHEYMISANGANTYTKMSRLTYASDSGLSYLSNPRVVQSEADAPNSGGSQIKKSTFQYIQRDGMWLPSTRDDLIYPSTLFRRTVTEYTSYPSQYILGLPQQVSVYAGDGVTLLSRIANSYDQTGTYTDSNGQQAQYFIDASADGVIQHEAGYNGSFTARGNLTSTIQYSVSGGAVNGSRIVKRTSYDTNGNVRAQADAAANRSQVLYGDYCLNKPGGIGQTHVQPYAVQNPIGFKTGSQWEYYTGLTVKTFNSTPGSGAEQQVVTTSYDYAGRPQLTTRPDGGWLRTDYWDNWLVTATSQLVDAGKTRYKFEALDGAGRVIRKATDHPNGSSGAYSGQIVVFNQMGETEDSSNVIAVNATWTPILDDAQTGFLFTHLTRDELGRLKIITRPDNNTISYSYDGCGCAGNSETRVTDELGHYTVTKTDFLGRLVEAAEPAYSNPGGPAYSKATYIYDELDRLLQIQHSDYSGKVQTRNFSYDGYGDWCPRTRPKAAWSATPTRQTICLRQSPINAASR